MMERSKDGRELVRKARGNIPGMARPVGPRSMDRTPKGILHTIIFEGRSWRFRCLWPRMVIRGVTIHMESDEPLDLRVEVRADGAFVSSFPVSNGTNDLGIPALVDVPRGTVLEMNVVGDGNYTIEGMMIVSWFAE